MRLGGASPETFASAPCIRNAFLPQSEKSLVLASAQGNLGIPAVAQQARWLFGPRGSAVRQDVLAATDADVSSNDAPRAKKRRKKVEIGGRKEKKVNAGGQNLNGINQKPGRSDRCYWRNSQCHPLPEFPSRGESNRILPGQPRLNELPKVRRIRQFQ